jgi:hypothetical protein
MNARATLTLGRELIRCFRLDRKLSRRLLGSFADMLRGSTFAEQVSKGGTGANGAGESWAGLNGKCANPLREYFEALEEGPGIWKWLHYFEVYERHFRKFVGQEVHIMEVGVYSGGSLEMWKSYFGDRCHVYGVDIEPACRAYEGERKRILIGDQADRSFWAQVRSEIPRVDVFIDDGGHLPEQQIVTLEEMLPHLSPGGVFVCEDIHGVYNPFSSYVHRFADSLNHADVVPSDGTGNIYYRTSALQRSIHSAHFYPFVTVIEKQAAPSQQLACTRHGSEWQPFL